MSFILRAGYIENSLPKIVYCSTWPVWMATQLPHYDQGFHFISCWDWSCQLYPSVGVTTFYVGDFIQGHTRVCLL